MNSYYKYAPILFLVLIFLLSWLFGLSSYLNLETVRMHQHVMEQFVSHYYVLSILMYGAVYVFVTSCSIPVATFFTILGGFLFNQWLGTLLTVVSATCGASILFLIVKPTSKLSLTPRNRLWMKTLQAGFQRNAFSYLLMLRFVPFFPFFMVNLASALLRVPLRIFFWGTLIGIFPVTFIYTSVGVALQKVIQQSNAASYLHLDPDVFIALTGLGVLVLIPILFKRFQKNER